MEQADTRDDARTGWDAQAGRAGVAAQRRGTKAGCARVIWSRARRAAFLDVLAATCNVSAAAAAAGVLPGSVYQLRRRDPDFAVEWAEALAAGDQVLETQLVGHALAGGVSRDLTNGDVAATGPINVDLALKLLGTHRDAGRGKAFRGGTRPQVATRAETNAAILKRLRIMESRQRGDADGSGEGGRA